MSRLLTRRINLALRLSGRDLIAAAWVCSWLIHIRLALAFRSFHTVIAIVSSHAKRPAPYLSKRVSLADIAIWVDRSARLLPGSYTCLPKALTAYLLYRRLGMRPILRVGARREDDGEFQAHAWVELNGAVVIGKLPSLGQYRVFEQLGELSVWAE